MGAIYASLSGTAQSPWYYACMVYWNKGALRRNCRQKPYKTSFSPFLVFLFSRNSSVQWRSVVPWHLWVGRARHPGPDTDSLAVEVFNFGEWRTHGDLVSETQVDIVAVEEHRLIPARVRSEWARLRGKGLATVWAPASQDTSHVGHVGVRVIGLMGALVSFHCPPLRLLSLSAFLIVDVLLGACHPWAEAGSCIRLYCMGTRADNNAEQLAMTDQLFDAALGGRCTRTALLDCWGFQRGANQDPLPGKRDPGWTLG